MSSTSTTSTPAKTALWTCKSCTLQQTISNLVCSNCSASRPSLIPPSSVLARARGSTVTINSNQQLELVQNEFDKWTNERTKQQQPAVQMMSIGNGVMVLLVGKKSLITNVKYSPQSNLDQSNKAKVELPKLDGVDEKVEEEKKKKEEADRKAAETKAAEEAAKKNSSKKGKKTATAKVTLPSSTSSTTSSSNTSTPASSTNTATSSLPPSPAPSFTTSSLRFIIDNDVLGPTVQQFLSSNPTPTLSIVLDQICTAYNEYESKQKRPVDKNAMKISSGEADNDEDEDGWGDDGGDDDFEGDSGRMIDDDDDDDGWGTSKKKTNKTVTITNATSSSSSSSSSSFASSDHLPISSPDLMKFESTGSGWGDDAVDLNDDDHLTTDVHWEKWTKIRKKWATKDAELRAKSNKKSIFDDDAYKLSSRQIFTQQEIFTMLSNTLIDLMQKGEASGYTVTPIDDNVYNWNFKMHSFPSSSPLATDLKAMKVKYDRDYIEFEISFDQFLFPFYPPDVRMLWPRLENFLAARIVCLDELSLSKWSPVRKLSTIFSAIHSLLAVYGSIDVDSPLNKPDAGGALYTEAEIMLYKLSSLTEIAPRANVVNVDTAGVAAMGQQVKAVGGTGPLKKQQSWQKSTTVTGGGKETAKGEGGEDYVSYLAAQRKKNEEIRQILGTVLSELSNKTIGTMFANLLAQSCILPFIYSYISSDSIIDIERHIENTSAVLFLLRAVARHPSVSHLLSLTRLFASHTTPSLSNCMENLKNVANKEANAVGSNKGEETITPSMLKLIRIVAQEVKEGVVEGEKWQKQQLEKKKKEEEKEEKEREKNGKKKEAGKAEVKEAMEDDEKLPPLSDKGLLLTRTPSDEETSCPLCYHNFPRRQIERHVNQCLLQLDGAVPVDLTESSSTPTPSSVSPAVFTSSAISSSSSSNQSISCPICGDLFSASTITTHTDKCLLQVQAKEDEEMAKRLEAEEETKSGGKSWWGRKGKGKGKASSILPSETSSVKPVSVATRIAEEEKAKSSSSSSSLLSLSDDECPICNTSIAKRYYSDHVHNCYKCCVCMRSFIISELRTHTNKCVQRGKLEEEEKVAVHFTRKEQGILNKTQLDAVIHVQSEARKQSELQHTAALQRMKHLGLVEDDLKVLLRYVRNEAPIIIHLQLETVLPHLVKDTHYRNQFETNTSKGTLSHTTRTQWENRMFKGIYDKSTGYDRVKYGVLNTPNSPNGISACYAYGDSFMLLADNVRLRTTFADMDTGSDSAILASCEFYTHILVKYVDAEIKDMLEVASGKKKSMTSVNTGTYKEIQIHGPVRLNRDVKALFCNPRHKTDPNMVKMITEFCEKNHFPFVWMTL